MDIVQFGTTVLCNVWDIEASHRVAQTVALSSDRLGSSKILFFSKAEVTRPSSLSELENEYEKQETQRKKEEEVAWTTNALFRSRGKKRNIAQVRRIFYVRV